jgi:VanZ family protein
MKHWIEKNSIILSLLLVIAVMVMIYCFSAQTGAESGAMSGKITTWVLNLVIPDFANFAPEKQEAIRSTVGLIVRKLAHFSEYALLGFSLMLHIAQIQKKISVRLPWLWAWAVGTIYAASDEFHQGFVAGRGPSVRDVMIDSAGVIAGTMLLLWILLRKKKDSEIFPVR